MTRDSISLTRWARNGFFLGFVVAVMPWRTFGVDAGFDYYPWDGQDRIVANISQMIGAALGGAVLGALFAALYRMWNRG